MIFTGKNLRLVRQGLVHALAEVHNMIATCPDVVRYEADLIEYEEQKREYEKLLAMVNKAIAKEKA